MDNMSLSRVNVNEGASSTSSNTEDSDLIAELWKEYKTLAGVLIKQGTRKDPALLMRLTVVMMDLGLYQPSPP